jgi:hypothetical protein
MRGKTSEKYKKIQFKIEKTTTPYMTLKGSLEDLLMSKIVTQRCASTSPTLSKWLQ